MIISIVTLFITLVIKSHEPLSTSKTKAAKIRAQALTSFMVFDIEASMIRTMAFTGFWSL